MVRTWDLLYLFKLPPGKLFASSPGKVAIWLLVDEWKILFLTYSAKKNLSKRDSFLQLDRTAGTLQLTEHQQKPIRIKTKSLYHKKYDPITDSGDRKFLEQAKCSTNEKLLEKLTAIWVLGFYRRKWLLRAEQGRLNKEIEKVRFGS